MIGRRDYLRTACGLAAAAALAALAAGQTPAPTPAPAPPAAPAETLPPASGLYVGAPSCASSNCHGLTRPRRVFDVLQNEYFTWSKSDHHATKAYPALFTERSKLIARNLRLPAPAAESTLCLNCHAMVVPKAKQVNRLDLEDGISCEGCHGPASGWKEGHTATDWSHQKSVEAGMVDLRSLEVRSRLCLSCHLGNAGKTVDHDLIAAGHPVLRFELDNYSESMPAHWMPFRDKQRKEGLRDSHGARAWALGQACSFRDGLDQLALTARSQHWPEFSELNCDSCHHTLTEQRYKTLRYVDRPGLPRWSPSRWAVLRLLVATVAPDAKAGLDTDVALLSQQLARLGTPRSEVAETAERISRTVAGVIPRLDAAPWGDPQVKRLLLAVADDDEYLTAADRASAEQAFYALQSLAAQLHKGDPRRARAGLAGTLESMNNDFKDDPYSWSPSHFRDQLAQIKRQVQALP